MSVDVDAICPVTDGLARVAEHRTHDILKEWARRHSIWGTTVLHGPGDAIQSPTLRDLVIASYVQGARDTAAVAAIERDKAEGEPRDGR